MKLFADNALLDDGWAGGVSVDIDDRGIIGTVATQSTPAADAIRVAGPLVPGMPNLHSHAFQRALAGGAETRGPAADDFWTWREAMYGLVARISPEQCHAIASQLYVEMLKAGFTSVGEFHYLHHDPAGRPYDTLTEMSDQVIAAARNAGIAITHLPVLYAHGGFGAQPPGEGQRRFLNDAGRYRRLLEDLHARYAGQQGVTIGMAPHSLRAVTPELLRAGLAAIDGLEAGAPVHVHIAEQTREVEECIGWSGCRAVEWLLDNFDVDARWCLVHATHIDGSELDRVVRAGAVVGLCPTTEANLGDGIFPALEFLRAGGTFGVGSDSNTSVSPVEELRTLEYGQRLLHRRRALLAQQPGGSVGACLYRAAVAGGTRALGSRGGRIARGCHADLVVLDTGVPTLCCRHGDELLDALIFAGNLNPVRDVFVAGRRVVRDGRHALEEEIADCYRRTLGELLD